MSGCVPCMKANENIFSLVDYANSLDIKNPKLASKIDQIVLGMVKESQSTDNSLAFQGPGTGVNRTKVKQTDNSIAFQGPGTGVNRKQDSSEKKGGLSDSLSKVAPSAAYIGLTGMQFAANKWWDELFMERRFYYLYSLANQQKDITKKKQLLKEAAFAFQTIEKNHPELFNKIVENLNLKNVDSLNGFFLLQLKTVKKELNNFQKTLKAMGGYENLIPSVAKLIEALQDKMLSNNVPNGQVQFYVEKLKKALAGKNFEDAYKFISNWRQPNTLMNTIAKNLTQRNPQGVIIADGAEVLKKTTNATMVVSEKEVSKLGKFLEEITLAFPFLKDYIKPIKVFGGIVINLGLGLAQLADVINMMRTGQARGAKFWCQVFGALSSFIQSASFIPAVMVATEGISAGVGAFMKAIDLIINGAYCTSVFFFSASDAKNLQGSITQSQLSPNDLNVANQLVNIKNKKMINDQFKGMVANNKIENPNEVGAYLRKQLLTKPIAQPGQPVAQPGQPAVA